MIGAGIEDFSSAKATEWAKDFHAPRTRARLGGLYVTVAGLIGW